MLLPKMPVGLHAKRATIFMAQPSGHGRYIAAVFNTYSGKQVPQIMVSDSIHSNEFSGPVHTSLAIADTHDTWFRMAA